MRLVVTGRVGQVAQALAERGATRGAEIVHVGRPELDLSDDPGAIIAALEAARPDVIVSAAAYTAVDKAESEPELAFAVNERGAGAVASAAERLGVPVIHLSTDYVFDGAKSGPYVEDDSTGPITVYGRSKLAGEQAVLAAMDNAAVLRTAWVYSPFGANFVKTMLRLAQTRDELGVVSDQRGNPTSALDIADGIIAVARNLVAGSGAHLRGVFHMAGAEEATWASFAEAIFGESQALGGPTAAVKPIPTADFPTPARRPANSRLDGGRLLAAHGVQLPSWRQSLPDIVRRLVGTASN
ncbi:MAG TPA: dTDP-4-dehydrorhamnose reductase [Sphingomicrobium sp.]